MKYKVTYYKGENVEETIIEARDFKTSIYGDNLVVEFNKTIGQPTYVFSRVISVEETD